MRHVLYVLVGTLTLGVPSALAQSGTAGTGRYSRTDEIGSVRMVTDAAGHVVAAHDYVPFGLEPAAAPDPAPLRYTGKERDVETALNYFGARYYASWLGRFTTVDPALEV